MLHGIHHDMPMDAYRDVSAASSTGLKHLAISPAHYRAYLAEAAPDTPALRMGRMLHMAVLEPERWAVSHVEPPQTHHRRPSVRQRNAKNPSAATVEAIEWWDAWDAENADKTVLTAAEARDIEAVAKSVRQHHAAARLLDGGHAEVSAFWTDQKSGECCKCRPDWLREDGILVDLKTVESAAPSAFSRAVWKYGWHRQAALYMDGVAVAGDIDAQAFVFVAVEKSPPYAVACYALDKDSIYRGRCEVEDLLLALAQCKIDDNWPGYSDRVEKLSLPAWANNTEG